MTKAYTLRRILIVFSFLLALTSVRAQYVAIPDTNFGVWLNSNGYSTCLTGNSSSGWQLDTLCTAVTGTIELNCSGDSIHNLTGIQYFTSLQKLNCSSNWLLSLPSLPAGLDTLWCFGNPGITSLPTLPVALLSLDCHNDFQLTTVPALPSGLQYLDLSNCSLITSVPPLPSGLIYFDCSTIPVTGSFSTLPAGLTTFKCNACGLATLPTLPDSLNVLECGANLLTSLPALPVTLTYLDCSDIYSLYSLPPLPAGLATLMCGGDSISSLPPLPPVLSSLDCSYNILTSLPALPPTLLLLNFMYNNVSSVPALPYYIDQLNCDYNPNLSCLPFVPGGNYLYLTFPGTQITCMPNRFPTYGFLPGYTDPDSLPLCTPGSGCAFYYSISGNVHIDTAATCAGDSAQPGAGLQNLKVRLYQNGTLLQEVFSSELGNYSFQTNEDTTYQVSVDTAGLPFFIACPSVQSRSVTVTLLDTLFPGQDFGIGCAGVDNGVLGIFSPRFRAGRTAQVAIMAGDLPRVVYGSTCANNSSGTVTTTISGMATYSAPAAGALTPTSVSGNTLSYTIGDFGSLAAGSFDIILLTDSAAAASSNVCVTTVINTSGGADVNPSDDSLTQCFTVVNSYDPNLKQCYPATIVDTGSQWLTYTIYFQNTGNDTAYTVIIKDTLNPNLDASSFQYLGSSNKAVVQLFGSAVVFTMGRINLPDSSADPAGSEGWIQYRVKTNTGLAPGVQITNSASVYFDLNPAVRTNTTLNTIGTCSTSYDTIFRTICAGDSSVFDSIIYYSSGYYSDTLTATTGCDSIITLNLTVLSWPVSVLYDSACYGGSYTFGGVAYTVSGTYTDTLPHAGINGCDSIAILHLLIRPLATANVSASICSGRSYIVGIHSYSATGVYLDTLAGAAAGGCDSIVVLNLTVSPVINSTVVATICAGASYTVGTHTFTTAGFYLDTLYNGAVGGCDSAVLLDLIVQPWATSTISAAICQGTGYRFGGVMDTATGIYSDTLLNAAVNGCDSVVTLILVVGPSVTHAITDTICQGSFYIATSDTFSLSGTYIDTLAGAASGGCDSIVVLHLTVIPPARDTVTAAICRGSGFRIGTHTYTTTGSYTDTLAGASVTGCDSIVVLYLTAGPTVTRTISATVCAGSWYVAASDTFRTSGIYADTLTGAAAGGCDSIVILNLTVLPPASDSVTASVCAGSAYTIGFQPYTLSGIYHDTLQGASVHGCDSIITLNLTVKPLARDTVHASVCQGSGYAFHGGNYTAAGLYSDTLVNGGANGCDSIVTLDLIIKSLPRDTITASICQGASFSFHGLNYSAAGAYFDTLINGGANGCDSVITLNLIVKPTSVSSVNAAICQGGSYTQGGNSYTAAGTYPDTMTGASASGCDSIVTLHLTVNPKPSASVTQIGNDSLNTGPFTHYQWLLNGASIPGDTTSGIIAAQNGSYRVVVYNADGCSDTSAAVVLGHVGIGEIPANGLIKLYPNPNGGSFTLEAAMDLNKEFTVYDMIGRIVKRGEIVAATQVVEMSEAADGAYILEVKGAGVQPPIYFVIAR